MKDIKYAIFDMDGTLLDSMHIWDTAAAAFLAMRGIVPKEFDLFRKQGYNGGINYMIKTYELDLTFDEVLEGLQKILWFYYSEIAPIKPGVKEFLQTLKAGGARLAVATATERYLVEAALKRNGILEYFDCIFTTIEVGKNKFEPDVFNLAAEALGAEGEVFVFEDALYAIRTAKNAGYKVVAIEDYSANDDKEEIKALADFYAEDYDRVKNYFEM